MEHGRRHFWSRFDLVSTQKDLQVSDYNASMPLDLKKTAAGIDRGILPYHLRSHLGDDYIKRTGRPGFENIRSTP